MNKTTCARLTGPNPVYSEGFSEPGFYEVEAFLTCKPFWLRDGLGSVLGFFYPGGTIWDTGNTFCRKDGAITSGNYRFGPELVEFSVGTIEINLIETGVGVKQEYRDKVSYVVRIPAGVEHDEE